MQHILCVAARALDVERMSFWTLSDEKVLICEMAYHRETGFFERGSALAAVEHADFLEAIRKSTPLAVEDCRNDSRVRSLRDYLDARGISSLLDFPIRARGELVGVLCLEHVGPPRRWSPSDEHFAAAAAQTATAAVEARALTEALEAVHRATFLDQTSRALGETLEVDEVARRAIALAMPKLGDGADIVLVEEGAIRNVAWDYATKEGRALVEGAMLERGRAGSPFVTERVIARRDSILVPDVTDFVLAEIELRRASPKIVAAFRALGVRSLIAAPLFVGNRIVGAVLFITVSRRYGVDDLKLAEEFALRLAAALENARLHQRAQAAVHARDEFIALAGHELRTPLTALQLSAQTLVRRSPSEDVKRTAESIVKQVERLERLSTQMLDATRISERELPLSRTPTDLAEIARNTAQTFAARLRRLGCSLVVRAEGPVVGEWDATQLERVISSLLDNAAKFGAGQPVEVAVQREGDDATLSVRDHGEGIPPGRVPGVFEAFERAVSAKHYGGLGLGLFVARAIVEAHGGCLTVESRLGEGTTFTARLPLKA